MKDGRRTPQPGQGALRRPASAGATWRLPFSRGRLVVEFAPWVVAAARGLGTLPRAGTILAASALVLFLAAEVTRQATILAFAGLAFIAAGLLLISTARHSPPSRLFPLRSSRMPHPSSLIPHLSSLSTFSSALLIFSLAAFGIARLPASNALWYEELTLQADISVRKDCVRDLVSTNAQVNPDPSGESVFSFVLDIQDADSPDCKDVSYVISSVCFDAQISPEGDVLWTTEPQGWLYDSKGSSALKWEVTGNGPPEGHNAFSFAVSGVLQTTTAQLLWKGGSNQGEEILVGEIIVPACPLAKSSSQPQTHTKSFGPASLTTTSDAPEPAVVDPVPVYLGETCQAFAPAGETWREFILDASGGLAPGDYVLDSLLALTLSDVSGAGFDWQAGAAVEAVAVQTVAGLGNVYRYDPAALAGAGLAAPVGYALTTVTFCVDEAAFEQPTDTTGGDGSSSGGSDEPPQDQEPELEAPDKKPEPYDPNPGPFFSLDPAGGQ